MVRQWPLNTTDNNCNDAHICLNEYLINTVPYEKTLQRYYEYYNITQEND